jgi:hypothetical protein
MRQPFIEILINLEAWSRELQPLIVKGDTRPFITALHTKIVDHLSARGSSLADLEKDNQAFYEFKKHARLKAVLAYDQALAAKPDPKRATDPVTELAKKIFGHRDELWKRAELFAAAISEDVREIKDRGFLTAIIFTKIIEGYLEKKGIRFEDIEANPRANQFFSSGRLQMAAKLHNKKRRAQEAPGGGAGGEARGGGGAGEPEFKIDPLNPARLAMRDVEAGAGLFTRAGIKAEGDEAALNAKIRGVLLAHHADKRADGLEDDGEIARAAIELRKLLKQGKLQEYVEAYRALKPKEDEAEARPAPKPGPG